MEQMQNDLKTDYKSIVAEVKAVIREIYTYSCIGSGLHIVLDDVNVRDEDIHWCQKNSIPEVENEQERRLCESCAHLLLQLPKKKRLRLLESYGRKWW